MERHPDSASSPGFRADPAQAQTAPRRDWLHGLVNFAVAVVVLAVAAGTFFLSYPGVHAIARQGGVSGQLARFYPGLFNAVLVIACVAAVMLRDARWWARCWAWLVAIVILGSIGAADVLHAMSYGLRQRPTEGVVAAAPVAAALLAFSLFLTMLRQSRPRPAQAAPGQGPARGPADGGAADQPTAPMMFSNVETVPVLAAGAVPRPPAPPIALPAAPAGAPTADLPDDGVDDDVDRAPGATAPRSRTPRSQRPRSQRSRSQRPRRRRRPRRYLRSPPTLMTSTLMTSTRLTPARTPAPTPKSPRSRPRPSRTWRTRRPRRTRPSSPRRCPPRPRPGQHRNRHRNRRLSCSPTRQTRRPTTRRPSLCRSRLRPAVAPAPHAIRYASSAAAEQFGDEDWEAEVDPALAGQVYPVLTSDPDIEVPPHQPGQSQDLEDDAPPFATAPFASVPRLNRVRVTPTPPTDDADED